MAEDIIYEGSLTRFVYWSEDPESSGALSAWLESSDVSTEERTKLASLLRIMGEQPHPRLHPSREKYNHEFGKIYAIKSFQIRLYGFARGVDFVILFFTKKKKNKLSKEHQSIISRRHSKCLEGRV